MGGERFSDIRDLIGVDMLGQSFFWKHTTVKTVILRPVHIVGAVRNAPSNYLRLLRPWTLAGFDPMVQIIHELDLARAIEAALQPSVEGVFNIAGCEPAPLSQLVELAGGQPRVVPHPLAGPILRRLWRYRLTSFPAPELDHLRYVCMVDGERAQDVLGFQPRYDLHATLAHLRLTRTD
jgi:UDP-glucose 4-epimerase